MIFLSPPVEAWADPGPLPYKRLRRWLIRRRVEARAEWIEQRRAYYERLARETEELERWEAQAIEWEQMMAAYQEEGEHLADMLPRYLHRVKLSYRRQMQDRKSERFYERVDYCVVAQWYFDESAYYFQIDTWQLPYGLSVDMFREPKIADTLGVNVSSEVHIEINKREHQRPGLWIVVMHRAGRGLIPKTVHYSDMMRQMPKSAPPLAFPIGVARNGKMIYGDMDELITVLVVGSRGAGKSNTINSIVNTWLSRTGPDRLRLFMTDLKGGLEFHDYHGIPHLGGDVELKIKMSKDSSPEQVRLGQEILTDPPDVIPVLRYINAEMNRRFEVMRGRAKKITAFNRKYKQQLSYWVLVIDELATLMDSPQRKDAEHFLGEIARKGRAVGIYLLLATQIPDKTVLTRQVAGNMDCRIVGRVADGPSSALSLGDGSWDATYLPKNIPGRMMYRWADKMIVQAPLIPDGTVTQTVKALRKGEIVDEAEAQDRAIAIELFEYALDSLAGYCSVRELYKHFKNRHSFHTINKVLKAYEVSDTGNGELEPIITLGEENDDYYLAPATSSGKSGGTPRQLIDADKFTSELESVWLPVMRHKEALRVARQGKSVAPVTQENTSDVFAREQVSA